MPWMLYYARHESRSCDEEKMQLYESIVPKMRKLFTNKKLILRILQRLMKGEHLIDSTLWNRGYHIYL